MKILSNSAAQLTTIYLDSGTTVHVDWVSGDVMEFVTTDDVDDLSPCTSRHNAF